MVSFLLVARLSISYSIALPLRAVQLREQAQQRNDEGH